MTEKTNSNSPEPSKKKTNRISIILALIAIIIIIQGIKIYLDYQEKQELRDQLGSTEATLATTIQELTDIQEELDDKIAEISKLGGDIAELEEAKAEVETQLKRARSASRRDKKLLADLRDKVEGYEILLKAKDVEIEKLKEVNDQLLTENTDLKTEKVELTDSITSLAQNTEELQDKVALASRLKVENINIVAVNSRGKERDSPFRKKQIDKLKVEFNIAENDVAPIEGKNILIRIVDQNDQVLFDVAKGSGTFIVDGKEEFYTANQEILFDNSQQQLTFLYDKGSQYEEGQYTLEVYTEGYKMGSGQFIVR
ncbi:MAG: chromosome segregation protein SMC [Bacteroidota bacterium]